MTVYVDAENRVETASFDPAYGVPLRRVDANGGISGFAYDDRGNALVTARVLDPILGGSADILSTTAWYDNRGLPIEELDPLGRMTYKAYDGMGNLVSTTQFVTTDAGVVAVATHNEYT